MCVLFVAALMTFSYTVAAVASYTQTRPIVSYGNSFPLNRHVSDSYDDASNGATVASTMVVGNYNEQIPGYGDYATVAVSSMASVRELRQYNIASASLSWATSPNSLGITSHNSGAWLTFPFRIAFYDIYYDYVWVSSNGYIVFPNAVGLNGDYYSGKNFDTYKLSRTDTVVAFSWLSGTPDSSIPSGPFSVRWTGWIRADFGETYAFHTFTDGGVRLYVDNMNTPIIDEWTANLLSASTWSSSIALTKGMHQVKMEYYHNQGSDSKAYLQWDSLHQTGCDPTTTTCPGNGFIPVDNLYLDQGSVPNPPPSLPDSHSPNNILAAWWRDLDPSKGGSVTWGTDSIKSYVAVSWDGIPNSADGKTQKFQIQISPKKNLFGRNNLMWVYYPIVTRHATIVTIVGVEDELGKKGTNYAPNNIDSGSGVAIFDDGRDMSIKDAILDVSSADRFGYLDIDPNSRRGVNVQIQNYQLTPLDLIGTGMEFSGDLMLHVDHPAVMGAGAVLLVLGKGIEFQGIQQGYSDFLNDLTTSTDGVAHVKALAYDWRALGGYPSTIAIGFTALWYFTDHPQDNQPHSVTITTTIDYSVDSTAHTVTNQVTFTFQPNQVPVLQGSPPLSSPQVNLGTPATWTLYPSDGNNDPLTYTMDYGDGTTPATGSTSSGATLTLSHNYAAPNTYADTFRLNDAYGGSSTYSANAYVIGNLANFPFPFVKNGQIEASTSGNLVVGHTNTKSCTVGTTTVTVGGASTSDGAALMPVAGAMGAGSTSGSIVGKLDTEVAGWDGSCNAIVLGSGDLMGIGGKGVNLFVKAINDNMPIRQATPNDGSGANKGKGIWAPNPPPSGTNYVRCSPTTTKCANAAETDDYALFSILYDTAKARYYLEALGISGYSTRAIGKLIGWGPAAGAPGTVLTGTGVVVKLVDSNSDTIFETYQVVDGSGGAVLMSTAASLPNPTIFRNFVVGKGPLPTTPVSTDHCWLGAASQVDAAGAISLASWMGRQYKASGVIAGSVDTEIVSTTSTVCSSTPVDYTKTDLLNTVDNLVAIGGKGVNLVTNRYNPSLPTVRFALSTDGTGKGIYAPCTATNYVLTTNADGSVDTYGLDSYLTEPIPGTSQSRRVEIVAGQSGYATRALQIALADPTSGISLGSNRGIVVQFHDNYPPDNVFDKITVVAACA